MPRSVTDEYTDEMTWSAFHSGCFAMISASTPDTWGGEGGPVEPLVAVHARCAGGVGTGRGAGEDPRSGAVRSTRLL